METLIVFFVLALLAVPLGALVMLGTLWGRTARLTQRMQWADGHVIELQQANGALRQQLAYIHEQLGHLASEVREPEIRTPSPEPEIRTPSPEPEIRTPSPEPERQEPSPPPEPRPKRDLLEQLQAAHTGGDEAPPSVPPQDPKPPTSQPSHAQPAVAEDGGWERWLGVRGAAAAGAAVLVLAGLYFFKYSIEHNLINETMRVVLGTLVGVGCLTGAEAWLRRRHELLASCISGAGIAILYLTFWAAVARYGVISTAVAGGLMVLVTTTCCLLSIKRGSTVIAVFGLVGGFATPLLLSTGSDRPIALFSYLLLVDVALLYVAHVRRWPLLALASLLGTAGYQSMWIVGRMGPERLGWGMLLCIVFAALFALSSKERPLSNHDEGLGSLWGLSRGAAVLLPFMFALYFGLEADFGDRFYPLAAYLGVLVIGAGAIATRDNAPWLSLAASGASIGVLAAWLLPRGLGHSPVVWWELAGFPVAVALFMQLLAERERARDAVRHETSAAVVASSLGGMLITALAVGTVSHAVSPWPWLAAWTLLGLIMLRHACMSSSHGTHMAAAGGVGVSLLMLTVGQLGPVGSGNAAMLIGAAVGVAVIFQLAWLLPRASKAYASHAAALLPLMLLFALPTARDLPMPLYQAAALLLVLLIGFAVVRNRSAQWLVGALPVLAMVQWWRWQGLTYPAVGELELAYAAHALGVLLVGCWPLLLDAEGRARRWSWRAAALAGPVMFLPMLSLHRQLWGDGFIAVLPLGLAAFGLVQLLVLRQRSSDNAAVHHSAVVWLGAITLGFVTTAIPLQLENEWVTIGWSLLGLALLLFWQRRDHAGLKYSALALFGAVTVRLVANPQVLDYHPRGSLRVFNWISYTYLIPVACLVVGAWLLARYVGPRLRKWEAGLCYKGRDLSSSALGMAAVVIGFVWINLTIIDWFAVGRMLELTLDRLPARDLSMSLAWALYALLLLAAGVWRKSTAMRKVSLVLLLITCGKVFLRDLSHLTDLYRVMSLVGLALSLIMVSYAYQRIVFAQQEQPS